MQTIQSKDLTVTINELGAELTSVIDKHSGFNYIWDANPSVWPKHAPNLFPAIGRSMNDHYLVNGKRYEMPQHGVGFFHHYQVETVRDNMVRFVMVADEETRQYYPFNFKLTIQFEVVDKRLRMIDTVENPNDAVLSFALGTHPAWNIPFAAGETFSDYYVTFAPRPTQLSYYEFMFDHGAPLRTGKILTLPEYDGERLPLKHALFNNGLIVFDEANHLDELTVHSTHHAHTITAKFADFPQLCLWTQADEAASFLCLEPFYGVSDQYGQETELMAKAGNCHLPAHSARSFVIDYEIN